MPESFTGIRFRRLDREPLLGRCPGSRWDLAPCSWTPRFLKSSIPQVITSSCPASPHRTAEASIAGGGPSTLLLGSSILQFLKYSRNITSRLDIRPRRTLLGPDPTPTSALGSQSCQVCAVLRGQPAVYSPSCLKKLVTLLPEEKTRKPCTGKNSPLLPCPPSIAQRKQASLVKGLRNTFPMLPIVAPTPSLAAEANIASGEPVDLHAAESRRLMLFKSRK